MNLIDVNSLPVANRNIYNLIIDKYGGNISSFAKEMGIPNSTKINRLFQKDKRNDKYPVPSTDILTSIRERFGISVDTLLFGDTKARQSEEKTVNNINIIKGNNNNTNISQ